MPIYHSNYFNSRPAFEMKYYYDTIRRGIQNIYSANDIAHGWLFDW